jgi:hypothetical protein
MHIKIDDHCDEVGNDGIALDPRDHVADLSSPVIQDLFCHFTKTNEFIEEAMESLQVFQKNEDDLPPKKGGILVHCFMGASRSATVVAAYRMVPLSQLNRNVYIHPQSCVNIACLLPLLWNVYVQFGPSSTLIPGSFNNLEFIGMLNVILWQTRRII